MKRKTISDVAKANLHFFMWIIIMISISIHQSSCIFYFMQNGAILHKISYSIIKLEIMFDMIVQGGIRTLSVSLSPFLPISVMAIYNIWIIVIDNKHKKSKDVEPK